MKSASRLPIRYADVTPVKIVISCFCITKNYIVLAFEIIFAARTSRITPYNFVAKIPRAKHAIQNRFQVMRRGRVAVQINTAGVFQHAMHRGDALRHINQVGEHAGFGNHLRQPLNRAVRRMRGCAADFFDAPVGVRAPKPSVLESGELRRLIARFSGLVFAE